MTPIETIDKRLEHLESKVAVIQKDIEVNKAKLREIHYAVQRLDLMLKAMLN